MSAFNSMVYRMLNVPMGNKELEEEEETIYCIAKVNGYDKSLIQHIIKKQKRSLFVKNNTTLQKIKEKQTMRMILTYYPPLTNKIKDVLKSVNILTAYASDNKIKNSLCNNKEKMKKLDKSGIYKMLCECYIGQTCRPCQVRWAEHMKNIEKKDATSSIVKHIVDNPTHRIIESKSKLLKQVRRDKYLNAWESFNIEKHKDEIINTGSPPLTSALFKFCI